MCGGNQKCGSEWMWRKEGGASKRVKYIQQLLSLLLLLLQIQRYFSGKIRIHHHSSLMFHHIRSSCCCTAVSIASSVPPPCCCCPFPCPCPYPYPYPNPRRPCWRHRCKQMAKTVAHSHKSWRMISTRGKMWVGGRSGRANVGTHNKSNYMCESFYERAEKENRKQKTESSQQTTDNRNWAARMPSFLVRALPFLVLRPTN